MVTKFRRQVLIAGISHGYGCDGARWSKAVTACGIWYTHKRQPDAGKPFASRTARTVDCMACVAARVAR
jgi:hypothetical protein